MNAEDLRLLADRAEAVHGRADRRLDDVHQRIRSARRRRTAAAVVATTSVVLALAVGLVVISGTSEQQRDNQPLPPVDSVAPTVDPIRPVVWTGDLTSLGGPRRVTPKTGVGTLHVGDREVQIDQVLYSVRFWSMFVVDSGAVYAKDDHTVWFTDGGEPRRIATDACVIPAGDRYSLGLATGNAGPLVAWFDCAPGSRGELVVYDTDAGNEVARHQVPACAAFNANATWFGSAGPTCLPTSIVGDNVYFGRSGRWPNQAEHLLDLVNDEVRPAGRARYLADVRAHPRGVVVGDTWETGTPTEGTSYGEFFFRPVGARLRPYYLSGDMDMEAPGIPTRAFDTASGLPIRLELPAGYRPAVSDVPTTFTIFEWLDDDTIALAQDGFSVVGDILVCHLSDGRCQPVARPVTEKGIVPNLPLPG